MAGSQFSSGLKGYSDRIDFLPFRAAFRGLKPDRMTGDLSAAFNVALLAFPQGMAYALIAGIPLQYGIFGSAVAAILGSVFAKSPCISLGPTNATSVLLLSAFAAFELSGAEKVTLLPLIVFISAVLLLVGALARVASLIQYISKSVITGYITAAAILIVANQMRHVLGVDFEDGARASTFFQVCLHTFRALPFFDWFSVATALVSGAVYLVLSRYFARLPNVAITLLLMSLLSFALEPFAFAVNKLEAVRITDWSVSVPVFDLHQIRLLTGTAVAIAILSLMEGVSIGKTLAARTGKRLDVNQEMFSLGFANLGCAFLSSMPASGSLTRSMLNWKSGAKTPMVSLYIGLFVLVAAYFFGPLLHHVPKPTLAVLVIAIGFSLVNPHQIFVVTHSTGSDKLVFYITLLGGLLLPLDMAIVMGTVLSIFLFLKKAAKPELVEYAFDDSGKLTQTSARSKLEVSIVHVEGDLFFGSADLFRDQIRRIFDDDNLKILVLRMKNAHILDATCVLALEELMNYMKERDRYLLVSGVRKKILKVLDNSGLLKRIGDENVFEEDPDNPTYSTACAMKRAQQILGGREAEVTIYVNPNASESEHEHGDAEQ